MKKVLEGIRTTICVLLVLAMVFGIGYYFGNRKASEPEVVIESANSDIVFPTEVEKRIVTKEEVETKLFEIGELSTYSGEYKVEKSAEQSRYILDDVKIPGTTNTIDITCNGIVKVGFDIDDIVVKIDNDSQTIYISLPKSKVNNNYVIWDTVECREKNTVLNPIDFAQYQELISEIEDLGLQQVEQKGIYDAAEDNLKMIICNFLSGFVGFEIVFM